MKGKKLAYSLLSSLALVAATFSIAQPASAATLVSNQTKQLEPPLEEIYIKDFTYAGSGCPSDSVGYLL